MTKKEREMKIAKLSKKHLVERCNWLNDPNVYQHMNMQYPITLEEAEKWHERALYNPSRFDLVFEDETNVLAMTGLTNVDTVNGLVEFYIIVNPNLQGKGIGKLATQFTINYAFLHYNIHKVYLYTNEFNERANKLYEGLGFQLEGTLRKHKFKNGVLIDRCIYGLLKEDWNTLTYSTTQISLDI